jgi:hypothetical protein
VPLGAVEEPQDFVKGENVAVEARGVRIITPLVLIDGMYRDNEDVGGETATERRGRPQERMQPT